MARLYHRGPTPADTVADADWPALLHILFYYDGAFELRRERRVSRALARVLAVRNGAFGQAALCELDDDQAAEARFTCNFASSFQSQFS